MSAMSNYLENLLVDRAFRSTGSYSFSTAIYVSLHTADPTDAGSTGTEVEGGSYARQVFVSTNAASSGVIHNTTTLAFPAATADWGTVTHFGLWDDGTTGLGNLLVHGALSTSKTVASGDIVQFSSGTLDITFA